MAHAQMLVLSSNHEGLSNVLIAAMSCAELQWSVATANMAN